MEVLHLEEVPHPIPGYSYHDDIQLCCLDTLKMSMDVFSFALTPYEGMSP
jgi:hypothetical protein